MKYAVVIERGATSYGAHVPDLPGCVAVAETKTEVCVLIREAIELYLEALEEDRASWQRRIARLRIDRQRPVSDLRPGPWVAPMGLDRKRPV